MKLWFLLLLAVFLAGCDDGSDPVAQPPASPPPVVLGAVYSLTGVQAALDVPSSLGARLAASQQNVQLFLEDGASDANVVRTRVDQLLTRNPSAVFGLSDTDLVLAGAPRATGAGRAFVTSGATSPLLPTQVPGTFLACFGDNAQAAAGAEYAFNTLGARNVSIVYDSDQSYTRLLQTYFQTRFTQLGGQVTSKASYAGSDQIVNAVGQIATGVDLVYVSAESAQDARAAHDALRARGYTRPMMGGDGYDGPEIGTGESNVFFTTHANLNSQDPVMVQFLSQYAAAFPGQQPTAFSALGYDTVNLLVTAIRLANSTDPAAVRNALGSLTNFTGVTGQFSYSPQTPGVPRKTVTLIQVQNGVRSTAAQFIPQSVPAPDTPFLP